MKHTQGTWIAKDGQIYPEETGKTLALIPYYDKDDNEQKANAQLIASAPELLETCKMALIEYRGLKNRVDIVELGCDGNDDACTNLLLSLIHI